MVGSGKSRLCELPPAIDDVRLHDLRRTVGSWLAQAGNSLYLIGPDGKPLSVLPPIAEYEALVDYLADLEDIEDAREALARIKRGEEETIPWEVVKAEHGL